jgi:hypothetical protein
VPSAEELGETKHHPPDEGYNGKWWAEMTSPGFYYDIKVADDNSPIKLDSPLKFVHLAPIDRAEGDRKFHVVKICATVDESGKITNPYLASKDPADWFNQNALLAASQSTVTPPRFNGKPITVSVEFYLFLPVPRRAQYSLP